MIYIEGMKGLGDNIYQRAFINQFRDPIYLETPWPEIYQDLQNVRCVKTHTELRTQRKNEQSSGYEWAVVEGVTKSIRCFYRDQGIFAGMRETLGVSPGQMDLPDYGPSIVGGKYVVIRPVTVRAEWPNEARNPLPKYIYQASLRLKAEGIKIVSVADLSDRQEWPIHPLPESDIEYHSGELSVCELLALCAGAEAIIGGIGWIVPAAMALNKKAFVVCGGQGVYNSPDVLTHQSVKHKIHFAVPDNLCMCTEKDHSCDKRISNYEEQLTSWIAALG